MWDIVQSGEDTAITEIEAAIGEIKKASIDDGKDLNDQPNIDVKDHGSRLLRAIEAIKSAHDDISGEEDNPEVSGLRRGHGSYPERPRRYGPSTC